MTICSTGDCPLTCCCASLSVSMETRRTGSTDEACRDVDALKALDPRVTRPSGARRRTRGLGPHGNLRHSGWCGHRLFDREVFVASTVFSVTSVSLWTDSTDEGAQRVVAADSGETRSRDTLIYVFSTCSTCHSWWADAGEGVGAVNTAAQSAGVRFTVINVHLTPFTSESIETHAQVFPAAGGEVDVGDAGSSIQTLTRAHRYLHGGSGLSITVVRHGKLESVRVCTFSRGLPHQHAGRR